MLKPSSPSKNASECSNRFEIVENLHRNALSLFNAGAVPESRDITEKALEACAGITPICPSNRSVIGEVDQEVYYASHKMFADLMMLLAAIRIASKEFYEAERLLVTCQCYVKDCFENEGNQGGVSGCLDGKVGPDALLNMALATISYSRAVLRVDEYLDCLSHHSNTLDVGSSVSQAQEDSESQLSLLAERLKEARNVLLTDASSRLQDCLGEERRLLGDVWHTRGVCHQLLHDPVAALMDYQKSIEVRLFFLSTDKVSQESALKLALTLEQVVQLYRRVTPRSSPSTLTIHPVCLQQVLQIISNTRRAVLGENNPMVSRAIFHEGILAAEQGRQMVARGLLQQCLELIELGDKESNSHSASFPLITPSKENVLEWLEKLG